MIGTVQENKELHYKNVIHYRDEITLQELADLKNKVNKFLSDSNATQVDKTILVNYGTSVKNGCQMLDIEIFVPINKELHPTSGFDFIPEFNLKNALYVYINSEHHQLEEGINALIEYMQVHRYKPTTPFCLTSKMDILESLSKEKMEIDVYVGVSQ